MAKKVLIISASAGSGHIRAAQAIEKALAQVSPGIETRHIDALDYTPKLFAKMYSQSYLAMANKAPALWGWLYGEADKEIYGAGGARFRKLVDRLNAGKLVKFIKDFAPDRIVMTHFLPAEIMSHLKRKKKLDLDCSVVITDFDVHAFWIHPFMNRYFVPSEEVAFALERREIDRPQIKIVGIPIDPVFAKREDADALKEKLGVRPGRKVILISSGGFGVGNVKDTVGRLAAAVEGADFLVVCGKNPALKKAVEALPGSRSNKLHALGFVDNMHELMSVSDVMVSKAGALTVCEALAKALPLVIISPIPGQEERNTDYLLEQGAAVKASSLYSLEFKLARLIRDEAALRRMSDNARRIARPNAATEIAREVTR